MDSNRFDDWSRRLARHNSRRGRSQDGFGAAALGGALAGLGIRLRNRGPNIVSRMKASAESVREGSGTTTLGQQIASGNIRSINTIRTTRGAPFQPFTSDHAPGKRRQHRSPRK